MIELCNKGTSSPLNLFILLKLILTKEKKQFVPNKSYNIFNHIFSFFFDAAIVTIVTGFFTIVARTPLF